MEEHDAIEKFGEFFREIMAAEIDELAASYPEKRSLAVDYRKLEEFGSELADYLLEFPDEALWCAEKALQGLGIATHDGSEFKPHCRFFALPESRNVMVLNLGAEHLDKFISVEGIVSLATEIKPVIKTAAWECLHCGEKTRTHPEKNILKTPDYCSNKECGRRDFKHLEKEDEFVNMQNAQMQDLVEKLRGNAPAAHISLWMEDDIVNVIQPGEKFVVTGILRKRAIRKDGKLTSVYEKLLEVNHLERSEKEFEELEVSLEEEKELVALSKREDLFDVISKSIAPSIYGYTEMKTAIALQLFGGNMNKVLPDGKRIRGETHVLLIGDPGTAKTATLQYVSRLAPKCIYVSGKGTSGVGLCVAKDSLVEIGGRSIHKIGEVIDAELKQPCEDSRETGAFFENKNMAVKGLDENFEAKMLTTEKIWRIQAPKEMVRVETKSGKELKITANTPLLAMTTEGPAWVKSKNLTTRAFVATVSKPSKQTLIPVPEALFKQIQEKHPQAGKNIPRGAKTLSRKRILSIAEKLPAESSQAAVLKKISSESVNWDEITKLEVIENEDKWVYDFTLPSHAFFANGIAAHNTAAAEKDEFGEGWVLKAGAMVLASGGQVNVDELDKMDENDRSALHEALESGTISIAKAGIVTRFNARTSVLAAANPQLGRFNPNEPPAAQFAIGPTLMSLDGKEPILVRKNSKVTMTSIGALIDGYYSAGKEVNGVVPVADLEVACFDCESYKIKWGKASYVFRHRNEEELYEVLLESGRRVKITPGHSIFVFEDGEVKPKMGSAIRVEDYVAIPNKLPESTTAIKEFNLASELAKLLREQTSGIFLHEVPLEVFDRIGGDIPKHWKAGRMLPLAFAEKFSDEELSGCSLKCKGGVAERVPCFVPVDSRFMRLLGYYIAEGSLFVSRSSEHLMSLSFGAHEKLLHDDVRNIVKELFNHEVSFVREGSGGLKVNFANKIAYLFFRGVLGLECGAENKRVPEIVWNSEPLLQKEFLKAYHDGDWGVTVSKGLASDLLFLLLQQGAVNSMAVWAPRQVVFRDGHVARSKTAYSLVDSDFRTKTWKGIRRYGQLPIEPVREAIASLSQRNFRGDYRSGRKMKRISGKAWWKKHILDNRNLAKMRQRIQELAEPASLDGLSARWMGSTRLEQVEGLRCYLNRLCKKGLLEKTLQKGTSPIYRTTSKAAEILGKLAEAEKLLEGDLAFVRVKEIRRVPASGEYVYDVSVPGEENFVAGFGGIICHNSRFDLLFPIKDILDEVQDRKVAEHILKGHRVAGGGTVEGEEAIKPAVPIDLLRKYIAYARRNFSPTLSEEASVKIQDYYLRLRRMGEKQNYYPVTARQIEGLVRLAEASAKARLSPVVEAQDADRAISLTDYVLKTIFLDVATGRIDSDIINIGQPKSKLDRARTVLNIIEEKEKEVDMVAVEDVIREAEAYGLDERAVRDIIEQLHKDTVIVRPRGGFVSTGRKRRG